MAYREYTITPASSGFGEYEASPGNGEAWTDQHDLLSECEGNVGEVFELGRDDLPDGLEDISGSIRNKPARVFGYVDDFGAAHYFGIGKSLD